MTETNFKYSRIGSYPADWKIEELREHLVLLTDYDANGSFADMANNVTTYLSPNYAWYVRATDLEQNSPLSEVHYTDEASYKFLRKSSLFGGEVLLAKRGDIGKVYLFKAKTAKATLGPNLYLLKLQDTLLSSYLYCYFKSPTGQRNLKAINASTSLGAIYKEDVKELLIPIPPTIAEQERIAGALSSIDTLIGALTEQIEKKRHIKQGTMQQLLTGKKRLAGFTGAWKEVRLGDVAKMNSGGTPTSTNPAYYNGDIPFLSISDMTSSGKYIQSTEKTITQLGLENSSARLFPAGTLMYAMYASIGKCSITNIDTAISQAILGFKLSDALDRDYLYYHFCFIENIVKDMGQTGTQSNLSKKIVEDFELTIPPTIAEQSAIAAVLSRMDTEIAALEQKRDKYIAIKSGMMQNLLTGKIRLV